MNRIVYLATTEGCEACNIMNNILRQVRGDNHYIFFIETTDFKKLPEFIKVNVPLTDFPTMIFVENDIIKYHVSGTMTNRKLQDIIKDIHFD